VSGDPGGDERQTGQLDNGSIVPGNKINGQLDGARVVIQPLPSWSHRRKPRGHLAAPS
jgi:hypothetical protein